ncbi:sensor histidine kinase [Ligilactobacillus cholophilus]|uniref:sensor histidine kinase n=1 Tax=Ligilactobacillus cholophilus TaxID=3050131 RepID=UPI0025B0F45A|nr:ATP-binding protein [Ligilactobacillus cholophilus]
MKLKLTSREKRELFLVGLFTLILLIISNIAIYILLNEWVRQNPGLEDGIFQLKMSLALGPNDVQVGNWGLMFIFLVCVVDIFVVYLRVSFRYRQIQLLHVITELHFIASGHFDHRITFTLSGQMQRVVESINTLVDSTIKAMEEERQIEKSKDELITNVSHDIRTPLTSIIGYLGLIENHQFQSEEDLLKFAHIAYLKSNQMKSLVDDLFEYAKVRQTDTPLELMDLSLNSLFEQLEASFELEAKQNNMKIVLQLPQEDLKMQADPEKFARIFNNLITNALKYGEGAKHIYLSARKVSGTEVEVCVSNDGKPIPKESLPQVFDRFYRVEKSRNTKTGGTGLGLTITQRIVDLHHGTIKVESNDKLTSFIMYFPIKQPEKAQI